MKKSSRKVVNVYFTISELEKLLSTAEVTITRTEGYQINARLVDPIKPGKFMIKLKEKSNG